MRRLSLFAASLAIVPVAEAREIFVAEFRIAQSDRATVATGWRDGGDVFVDGETLTALGLRAPHGSTPFKLQDLPGARVSIDDSESAVTITCTASCYEEAIVQLGHTRERRVEPRENALSLNTEAAISHLYGRTDLSGLFDFAAAGRWGLFEHAWVSGARSVRLDTRLSFDDPERRTRLIAGDALTRGGMGAAPVRFTGLQWGVDFALDPSFVTFPAPSLAGEAAAPSVIDVFIDDSRRYSGQTNGGPFSIENAPVTAGAGVAQIVVTDVLGRAQTISVPFYASAAMLRPGLADFSAEAGVERLSYGSKSFDYGRAFVSGSYRRGLASWLTGALRAEGGGDLIGAGAGLSLTHARLGQVDLGAGLSLNDGESGEFASISWTREGDRLALGAAVESASEDFARRGFDGLASRYAARFAASWRDERLGAIGVTYAARERVEQAEDQTISLLYAPPALRLADLTFTATWTGAGGALLGLTMTRPMRDGGARTLYIQDDGDGLEFSGHAQRSAPSAGGMGFQFGFSSRDRLDAGFSGAARYGEARFEVSRAGDDTGLRGRFSFGLASIGGAFFLSQATRDAFAVVDVGAPNVSVWHDGRAVGRTDLRGRLLVPSLRSYDVNRLTVSVDELPAGAEITADEIILTPRARAGIFVRAPIQTGMAGVVRIVDETGAPLPQGAVLTRTEDGARFPIGADGRIYLSGVEDIVTLTRHGCVVRATPADIARGEISCVAA